MPTKFITSLGVQQCQAQGLVFYSCFGIIQDRIRMCKIKVVNFKGVWMFRTPVSIVKVGV